VINDDEKSPVTGDETGLRLAEDLKQFEGRGKAQAVPGPLAMEGPP
jgi:hypothetical protein